VLIPGSLSSLPLAPVLVPIPPILDCIVASSVQHSSDLGPSLSLQ
jgi:hypothetical protein